MTPDLDQTPLLSVDALNKSFGIYFDAKKIFATSDTTWKLPTPAGLAPGTAKVKLDPLVLNAGVSFRF